MPEAERQIHDTRIGCVAVVGPHPGCQPEMAELAHRVSRAGSREGANKKPHRVSMRFLDSGSYEVKKIFRSTQTISHEGTPLDLVYL